MDATGRWVVEAATPLGRLRFDVRIEDDGRITAERAGQRIEVEGVRLVPEGDGLRARWTQRLTAPVPLRVAVDALVVGDRLEGVAAAGPLLPRARLVGRRVG